MTDVSTEELEAQRTAAEAELRRRAILEQQEQRLDDMCLEWLDATGARQGDDWVQPTGLLGAYPRGWQVEHDGRSWRSTVPGAVLPPGAGQWEETSEEPVPYWVPGDYTQGSLAQAAGRVWEAITDIDDGPSPSTFPGGWRPVN